MPAGEFAARLKAEGENGMCPIAHSDQASYSNVQNYRKQVYNIVKPGPKPIYTVRVAQSLFTSLEYGPKPEV